LLLRSSFIGSESSPLPNEPGKHDAALIARHGPANNFVLQAATSRVTEERFEVALRLPALLPWSRLTLRVYVTTEGADGLAVLTLPMM